MSQRVKTQALSDSAGSHLIFDQDCQLCVSITHRLSGTTEAPNVRFVPYQSREAQILLGTSYVPGCPKMAYLIDSEGNTHQGLDAFIPLIAHNKWGKWVLRLWKYSLFRSCSQFAYGVIAKYRYAWFGAAKLNDR